ncbi:hypothetical protein PPERSA_11246 [Pseudocohnilembus persalinus]|uniref:Uncharacterized protein n=1 Tax=Pseudocohnilembus persalinus TaxID=266149 RepID=A0A0V0QZN4_PSEPJ|nr:hypothetical protein PPERSA_11246 [Pseudocohnilembus persalinus]|eukprot:KRX07697.1 hypothetical protein PPERSA_11246 [Pseudocohnilembus persalinus]
MGGGSSKPKTANQKKQTQNQQQNQQNLNQSQNNDDYQNQNQNQYYLEDIDDNQNQVPNPVQKQKQNGYDEEDENFQDFLNQDNKFNFGQRKSKLKQMELNKGKKDRNENPYNYIPGQNIDYKNNNQFQQNQNDFQQNDQSLNLSGDQQQRNLNIQIPQKNQKQQNQQENSLNFSGDLSPINENFEQTEEQKSCDLVTSNFDLEYSLINLQLQMKKNYNLYTKSRLYWKFNPQFEVFDFILQDLEVNDIRNNETSLLPENMVKFMVDENGIFIGISDEQEYIQNLMKLNKQIKKDQGLAAEGDKILGKGKKKKNKKKKKINPKNIIKKVEAKIWEQSVMSWSDRQSLINQNQILGRVEDGSQNQKIFVCKNQQIPRDELKLFLSQQLQNKQFYENCFNSKKTFKDRLTLWGLDDEQQKEFEENLPEYIKNQKKDIKYRVLEKFDSIEGQIDEQSCQPYTVVVNQSKKLILENEKRDLFVDVSQGIKLFVFQWNNQTEQENQAFFFDQYTKFKDLCDRALKNTVIQLSRVSNLPLSFRAKVKSTYFDQY